jgi:hypothetical protein
MISPRPDLLSCSPLSPRPRSPANRMTGCPIRYVLSASVKTTAAANEVPPNCSGPLDLSAQDEAASALRTATPQPAVAEARSRPGKVLYYDTPFALERLSYSTCERVLQRADGSAPRLSAYLSERTANRPQDRHGVPSPHSIRRLWRSSLGLGANGRRSRDK